MFCVNCGEPYEPSYKFCNYCGYTVPSIGGAKQDDAAPAQPIVAAANAPEVAEEAPEVSGAEPPLPGALIPVVESAPYALFVSSALGSALLLSVLVFNIAEAMVRNRWEETETILRPVVALGTVMLARSARSAWRRVIAAEPELDAMLKAVTGACCGMALSSLCSSSRVPRSARAVMKRSSSRPIWDE